MGALLKAWITEHDADLKALTIESAHVEPEYQRLRASESVFPARDREGNRHVIVLSLFDEDDLIELYDVLGKYLTAGK